MSTGKPPLPCRVLTAVGAPVTIGGVISAHSKWEKARADILKKHPMAYLYETASSQRLSKKSLDDIL